jgi:hypothetical protein
MTCATTRPARTPGARACATTLLLLATLAPAMAAQAPTPPPAAIDGAWVMTLALPVGVATPSITFTRQGDELSGMYSGRYGDFPIAGLIRGQVVTFTFQMGTPDNPVTVCFTGEWVAGRETLKGTATIGELGQATWTAERDPEPKAPR